MVPPQESNPGPPALQSSALPTELILPRFCLARKSLECKQSIVLHFLDSLFLNRQWYTPFAPPPALCRTAYSQKHLKTIAHAKFGGGGGVNKVYYKGFTNSHLGSMYVAN